jgi:ADP-ribose pyrophosphatase YjhB (NUDIX family)
MYPRAAVATTVQLVVDGQQRPQYLLIQRANPPDQGKWSIPGGKIELGETTMQAAQRELQEETQLLPSQLEWHASPFMTTDAIVVADGVSSSSSSSPDEDRCYAFHYVIAQCFARVSTKDGETTIPLIPSDDASDAKWFPMSAIKKLLHAEQVSKGVIQVIERAEQLSKLDAFQFVS